MKLLIAGDTVPTPSNYALFESADIDTLLDDSLYGEAKENDPLALDFEFPLTNRSRLISISNPNLAAHKYIGQVTRNDEVVFCSSI